MTNEVARLSGLPGVFERQIQLYFIRKIFLDACNLGTG